MCTQNTRSMYKPAAPAPTTSTRFFFWFSTCLAMSNRVSDPSLFSKGRDESGIAVNDCSTTLLYMS